MWHQVRKRLLLVLAERRMLLLRWLMLPLPLLPLPVLPVLPVLLVLLVQVRSLRTPQPWAMLWLLQG
jgi:hypothetical protein